MTGPASFLSERSNLAAMAPMASFQAAILGWSFSCCMRSAPWSICQPHIHAGSSPHPSSSSSSSSSSSLLSVFCFFGKLSAATSLSSAVSSARTLIPTLSQMWISSWDAVTCTSSPTRTRRGSGRGYTTCTQWSCQLSAGSGV